MTLLSILFSVINYQLSIINYQVMLRTTLLNRYHFGFALHGVGVQSEALYSMALEFKAKLCTAWRWSSKRSFVQYGVGVQSEALALEFKAKLCTVWRWSSKRSFVTAIQSFALNSNVPTIAMLYKASL
jgi:hypothetical protein